MSEPSLADVWPPFGLRLRAGPLELSAVRDEDIPALVALAEAGIHDRAEMPFMVPWTMTDPADLRRAMAAHYWGDRAACTPGGWSLEFVVRHEGVPVGVQAFQARNYLVTRSGETGSWLVRSRQGRGIGTLMRQVVCAFVFDHLAGEEITSSGFVDNPASLAVSRKVGYVDNGTSREQRRPGELALSRRLVLLPGALIRSAYPVEVEGLAGFRQFIGLPDVGGPPRMSQDVDLG